MGPEQVLAADSLNYASSGALVFPSEATVATVALRIRQALFAAFYARGSGERTQGGLTPSRFLE